MASGFVDLIWVSCAWKSESPWEKDCSRDDLPSAALELVPEDPLQADGVVVSNVDQDRDALGLQRVRRELRHHGALEVVHETDAEDVVADLRDSRVRRRGRDHRYLVRLADRRRGEGVRRGDVAEHRHHVVLVDELGDDRAHFLGLGLVVLDQELQLLSEDASGGVDLVERLLRAVPGRDAERRDPARQRAVLADEDLASGGRGARFSAGENRRERPPEPPVPGASATS